MILQTIVLLIGVVGASFVLACASWQIVLSAFACGGTGYAIWQAIRAVIHRGKIRELWHRSLEFEPMLNEMDEDKAYHHFVEQEPKKETVKAPTKVVAPRQLTSISRFPIQKISSI